MSPAAIVEVLLMAFVLLAPVLMVGVLVAGMSRRTAPRAATATLAAPAVDPVAQVQPLTTAA